MAFDFFSSGQLSALADAILGIQRLRKRRSLRITLRALFISHRLLPICHTMDMEIHTPFWYSAAEGHRPETAQQTGAFIAAD